MGLNMGLNMARGGGPWGSVGFRGGGAKMYKDHIQEIAIALGMIFIHFFYQKINK